MSDARYYGQSPSAGRQGFTFLFVWVDVTVKFLYFQFQWDQVKYFLFAHVMGLLSPVTDLIMSSSACVCIVSKLLS